jgi:hypothetical protein
MTKLHLIADQEAQALSGGRWGSWNQKSDYTYKSNKTTVGQNNTATNFGFGLAGYGVATSEQMNIASITSYIL